MYLSLLWLHSLALSSQHCQHCLLLVSPHSRPSGYSWTNWFQCKTTFSLLQTPGATHNCMASIHYRKCSFYLHWERTRPHHIQDSIQRKINEVVSSSETIFKQQSGLRWALGWWEERQDLGQSLWRDGIPRFHPGVLTASSHTARPATH